MKKLSFLLLIALLLGGGLYSLRRQSINAAPTLQAELYPPVDYPIEEHMFVCILCSGPEKERALESIHSQVYHNYRIIQLGELETKLSELTSAIRECSDREIILILDGHGWLAHEWVLLRLNQFYANPGLWMTYGQNRFLPTYRDYSSRALSPLEGEVQNFRSYPPFMGPPISFYAALFKQIDPISLCYEGEFFPAAEELAFTLPLIELARTHSQFLTDVLYISTPNREVDAKLNAYCERHIRSLPAYPPTDSLSSEAL